jgi:hypothetical protein
MLLDIHYFEYKTPLNLKRIQFLNVGFSKKKEKRKLHIPQI